MISSFRKGPGSYYGFTRLIYDKAGVFRRTVIYSEEISVVNCPSVINAPGNSFPRETRR